VSSVASRVCMTTGSPMVARASRTCAAEHLLLHVARREVVVVVEPDLAERAARRGGVEHRDRDGGVLESHPPSPPAWCGWMPTAKRTSGHTSLQRTARAASASSPAAQDAQRAVEPGGARALDDLRQVVGELLAGQVAV
jgi:hypothetical protein